MSASPLRADFDLIAVLGPRMTHLGRADELPNKKKRGSRRQGLPISRCGDPLDFRPDMRLRISAAGAAVTSPFHYSRTTHTEQLA